MIRREWVRRGLVALGLWLAAWAFISIVVGTTRPALLAGVVFGVCAFVWLLGDGASAVSRAEWTVEYRPTPQALGMDGRLRRLLDLLTITADRRVVAEELHQSLTAAIDDRLRASYGVDRIRDAQAARRILGDDLDDYVNRPPQTFRAGSFTHLSRLLTRVESL